MSLGSLYKRDAYIILKRGSHYRMCGNVHARNVCAILKSLSQPAIFHLTQQSKTVFYFLPKQQQKKNEYFQDAKRGEFLCFNCCQYSMIYSVPFKFERFCSY